MSTSTFRMSSLRWPGRLALRLGHAVGVVHLTESGGMTTCNNLTIINLLLKLAGPLHERRVTQALLALQVGAGERLPSGRAAVCHWNGNSFKLM